MSYLKEMSTISISMHIFPDLFCPSRSSWRTGPPPTVSTSSSLPPSTDRLGFSLPTPGHSKEFPMFYQIQWIIYLTGALCSKFTYLAIQLAQFIKLFSLLAPFEPLGLPKPFIFTHVLKQEYSSIFGQILPSRLGSPWTV